MHARRAYGVVPNENGRYVMASLQTGEARRARITISQWTVGNRLQSLRLLHRGVYCGVPSFWKSAASRTNQDILIAPGGDEGFTPWIDRMAAAVHTEALSNNLLALVPEDSYLCTVPLFCGDPSLHSFITVHSVQAAQGRPAYFKIGIILNKAMTAVFTMAPGTIAALEFHLGRIQRSFARTHPGIAFPEHVYLLGIEDAFSSTHFFSHPLSAKIGNRLVVGDDELKALGCALAQRTGCVPVFSGPSKASASRHFRTAAWIASTMVIIAAMFAAFAPAIMNLFIEWKLRSDSARYRSIIMNDPRIQNAMARNDSLGASIIRLSAKSGSQTQWGRFLQSLGSERPSGLFFEKLGSEAAGSSSTTVRIAISGFAQSETMVTDLISRLQKTGLISNVSLTTMEKNKTQPNICDFKIICTLTITTR